MAFRLGDPTARDAGRLTLNPLKHLDPMGSIVFPALLAITRAGFLFGWAKPVPVDPRHFRRPLEGQSWVALAGPVSNLVLATVGALALRTAIAWAPPTAWSFASLVCLRLVAVNVVLAVFNLIPIPPLDGSWLLARVLPAGWREPYLGVGRYGFVLVMVVLMTPAHRIVFAPARLLVGGFLRLAGLDPAGI